jgi:hypothetical protein
MESAAERQVLRDMSLSGGARANGDAMNERPPSDQDPM